MAQLYVLNTTIRDHEIAWRWLGDSPRTQSIKAGQQVVVGGDLDRPRIDAIVEQNVLYGMRPAADIPREKGFIGLIYSIDKPVELDKIETQLERNEIELQADADERRENIAAAVADNVSRQTGKEVKRLEIEQVETGDVRSPDAKRDNPTVAVGTEYVAGDTAPRHRGRKSSRAG